jgi:hypothetical protein
VEPPSTGTAELAASPDIPGVETIGGVQVRNLTVGPPVPLPGGFVFYEVQASWEGPAGAVQRAYRDATGAVRVDVLYQTRLVFPNSGPAIASAAATPDGGVLAIGVCQGFCYGETGPITVISSTDGGMTWDEFGGALPNNAVVGASPGLVLLRSREGIDSLQPGGTQTRLASAPEWQPSVLLVPGSPPLVLVRGDDRVTLNRTDGSLFARPSLPRGAQVEAFTRTPAGRPDKEVYEVDWSFPEPLSSTGRIRYSGFMDGRSGTFRAVFRWDPTVYVFPSGGHWLTATRELRVMAFPITLFGDRFANRQSGEVYLPAVVDFEDGTISPILEHFADNITGDKTGAPGVLAIASGTFARVTTGADCLNVREQPAKASPGLGCFKDGVLLRLRSQPEQSADGITWVAVETPDGRPGWASAEFLER